MRQETPDRYDGSVIGSTPATREVILSVGRAHGLRPKISFGVYDTDDSNVRNATRKATVEVTKILGPDKAMARVTDLTSPIVPGDHIYSPLWSPGSRLGIALVGKLDIDNDGRDDRAYLKNLVQLNGGKVDAEDVKGKATGTVTVQHSLRCRGRWFPIQNGQSWRIKNRRRCSCPFRGTHVSR